MAEHRPEERLIYDGSLEPVLVRAVGMYGLGDFQSYSTIPVGYEDFNAQVRTNRGSYVLKVFASSRTPEEITRYEELMRAVIVAEVNCPAMHGAGDDLVYRDTESGLAMVAMDFVPGKTFYELRRSPNDAELSLVLEQAARINAVPHHPKFLFDSWAITNLTEEHYGPIRKYVSTEDQATLEQVITELAAVDKSALPHCLVHGDIIKSNVIAGDDGKMYILDFSVANWYPRIQELAVIVGNLMNELDSGQSFGGYLQKVVAGYVAAGGQLTEAEMSLLSVYARASYAAEFVGAMREKFLQKNDSAETKYLLELSRAGLSRLRA